MICKECFVHYGLTFFAQMDLLFLNYYYYFNKFALKTTFSARVHFILVGLLLCNLKRKIELLSLAVQFEAEGTSSIMF